MFSHEFTVTDSMVNNSYHHVHHADSLKFLEHGRDAHAQSVGISYIALQQEDVFMVVSDLQAEYLRELTAGNHFSRVHSVVKERRRFVFTQDIVRDNGKICICAKVILVCMSGSLRRAIAPPERLDVLLMSAP